MNVAFIGYDTSYGGNGLTLASKRPTGTTGLRLDSSDNTTVNGTLTPNTPSTFVNK